MPGQRGRLRSAFTLVELLIVMAIIALLIGLLVPAVQKVRESALRAQCTNNLSQLGKAVMSYNSTALSLPPSVLHFDTSTYHNGWATWAVLILPHIDQENVYREWVITSRYASQSAAAREMSFSMLFCPSRRNPVGKDDFVADGSFDNNGTNTTPVKGPLSDYVVCDGNQLSLNSAGDGGGAIIAADSTTLGSPPNDKITSWKSQTKLSNIQRGASNTLLIGEKHVPILAVRPGQGPYDNSVFNGSNQGGAGSWSRAVGAQPNGSSFIPLLKDVEQPSGNQRCFGGAHSAGVLFAFCDGSVRLVPFSGDSSFQVLLGQLARRKLAPNEAPLTPDF